MPATWWKLPEIQLNIDIWYVLQLLGAIQWPKKLAGNLLTGHYLLTKS